MERLFISLSHLQHSDTAAVKDSLPQTPAQGDMTFKARHRKKELQPNHSASLHACTRRPRFPNDRVLRSKRSCPFKQIGRLMTANWVQSFKSDKVATEICSAKPPPPTSTKDDIMQRGSKCTASTHIHDSQIYAGTIITYFLVVLLFTFFSIMLMQISKVIICMYKIRKCWCEREHLQWIIPADCVTVGYLDSGCQQSGLTYNTLTAECWIVSLPNMSK